MPSTTTNYKPILALLISILISMIAAWANDQHNRVNDLEKATVAIATDAAVLKQNFETVNKKLDALLARETSCQAQSVR